MLRAGNLTALFGWGLLALGSLYAWVFLPEADLAGWRFDGPHLRTTDGVVLESWETQARQNDATVWAARYRFEDEEGRRHTGVVYGGALVEGESVEIEYLAAEPVVSRIRGMRREPFSADMLWVLVFPVLGAPLILVGWRRGRGPIELLVHGRLGHGVLVGKQITDTKINGRRVQVLTFQLEVDGLEPVMVEARTHRPEALEDDEREPLVYHPDDPRHAIMLDHLPGVPRIEPDGTIAFRWTAGSVRALALPLLAVAVNVAGFVLTR